jgi:hypothetical protein
MKEKLLLCNGEKSWMKEVSKLLYAWIHLEKVHNLLCSKNGGVTAVPDLHSQLDSWQQTGVPEQDGGVTAVPDKHTSLAADWSY